MSTLVASDAAGINRVIFRLFTRWTVPHIDLRIDSLPPVVVQRAQHRYVQISEARNSGLGAMLAATVFLFGTYLMWSSFQTLIWTTRQLWQNVGLLAMAALCAGLLGKGLSAAWTRVKLMLVLLRLRRQLIAGNAIKEPARYLGRISPKAAARMSSFHAAASVADESLPQTVLSRPRRPTLLLHDTSDFKRLIIHLFTHLKLPSVRIDVDGVATLDVQRAQHRIARLSEACNCVLGAILAAAVILGGTFSVQWISSHNWDWMVPERWGSLGMVAVVALCAALTGWAIEMVWTRVKLMLVLRGVRHRLGA